MEKYQKKYQFYFPLYALRYSKDYRETLDFIISYCIVEYGYWLYSNHTLTSQNYSRIQQAVEQNQISNFDYENDEHYYFILASIQQGVAIHNIETVLFKHKRINNFISQYEHYHRKDVRVKVHRDLLVETRDGKFAFDLFRVYCAIKSILGIKPFCRITSERIKYCMLGFKSKKVFELEKCTDTLFSRGRIDYRINILSNKKLIDKVTFRKRIRFISTRFKGKQLEDVVTTSLAFKIANKEQRTIRNNRINMNVELKANEIIAKMNKGKELSELIEYTIRNANNVN